MTWVLNNYLGRYVENLNTDQLSIALLSGEVELENLPLRRDALRHLGAPVEIRAGFVGKVRLSIPVRQPRSQPWVISLERLYVVAGPVRLDCWDDSAEKVGSVRFGMGNRKGCDSRGVLCRSEGRKRFEVVRKMSTVVKGYFFVWKNVVF